MPESERERRERIERDYGVGGQRPRRPQSPMDDGGRRRPLPSGGGGGTSKRGCALWTFAPPVLLGFIALIGWLMWT